MLGFSFEVQMCERLCKVWQENILYDSMQANPYDGDFGLFCQIQDFLKCANVEDGLWGCWEGTFYDLMKMNPI